MARITILTPDVSENCLGRAYVLARLLQPRHDAHIVGPQFGPDVWAPLAGNDDVAVRGVRMGRHGLRQGLAGWRAVAALLDGDATYVSKPFATSLWAARRAGRPMLVDVDDFEPGIARDQRDQAGLRERLRTHALDPWSLHHRQPWNTALGDRQARRNRADTVSNRFLQGRYGGELVPHARDTQAFDPARFDAAAQRHRFGLPADAPIILFLGTARRHKGLDDLAEAVAGVPGAVLVVAGLDGRPQSVEARTDLEGRLGNRVRLRAAVPFKDAPALLAAADVVAIPQQSSHAAAGQIPAKVFDAMAMGRAVVATAVGDLPEVLAGCGRIVPPGDAAALRIALAELVADPALRRDLGRKARQRCIERYSEAALRPVLQRVMDKVQR